MKEIITCIETGSIRETWNLIDEIFSEVIKEKAMRCEEARKCFTSIANIILRISKKFLGAETSSLVLDIEERIGEIDTFDNIFDLREWLENFIDELAERCSERPKSVYSRQIGELKKYIHENYDKDISLAQASTFLNIGKNYFCNIFKKETGMTYNDYLVYVKMEKAKELLKGFEMHNSEIAAKLGYDNSYYFSTVFKKVVGVSPTAYKKSFKS